MAQKDIDVGFGGRRGCLGSIAVLMQLGSTNQGKNGKGLGEAK